MDHSTRLIIAKTICRLYALGLVALATSFAVLLSGSIVTAGLLAVAIGLALLYRWAFPPAGIVPMLYIVEFFADAVRVRWLRPSSVMPGIVAMRFRSNWVANYLLDRPARFFAWYGVPKSVTLILLCALAIGALAYAYRLLEKSGQLSVIPHRDRAFYLRTIAAISKLAIGIGMLIVVVAIWNDPPTGGRNPGGPGAGTSIVFAVVRAIPWLVIGSIGWAATAGLTRDRRASANHKSDEQ